MTKKELLKALEPFPDETVVMVFDEDAVMPVEVESVEAGPIQRDPQWFRERMPEGAVMLWGKEPTI